MEIRKLALILVAGSLTGCSTSTSKEENLETINFHKYAYSICIGSAFNSNEVKEDANRSANGHMEHGNISLDSYEELRMRIDSWLAKHYESKSGKSLQIMKCNDFFYSGEIQEIYDKYDPCVSKDGWLDEADFKRQCN
jgi:hypothetical protein